MPLEPAKDNPMVLRAPSNLPKAVIEIPELDADGNAIGGVRLPDMQVPLGVDAQQNPPLSLPACWPAPMSRFRERKPMLTPRTTPTAPFRNGTRPAMIT